MSIVRLFLCFLILIAIPSRGSAQASVAELRERAGRARSGSSLPAGAWTSIDYTIDVAERIERNFPTAHIAWRRRAERFLAAAEQGRDPFLDERGRVTNRGLTSPISTIRQGYAIYVPASYDGTRAYPVAVLLHGGSSNGNLFLGVALGNNMDWETYSQHLWDDYTPRWAPETIVVAPDGFGQVLWRWMGEADVLAVIDDVQRHYNVDADRISLGGLSNGGVGAYSLGMRHAWRFSSVMPMAGAPSWLQYAGGRPTAEERRAMLPWSGMHLIENSTNTNFRFHHGLRDPGPMRPQYVRELEARMQSLGLRPQVTWYDFGHDLLYLVHRHGRIYPELAALQRRVGPAEVRVVTGDYDANRQHWVSVTRIVDYPSLARVTARATDGLVSVTTENTREIVLRLREAPTGTAAQIRIEIDGNLVATVPRAGLTDATFHRADAAWQEGALRTEGLAKIPGLSGPLTATYRRRTVHVYGTQRATDSDALRRAAERGARGWPLWLWNHQQVVVADRDLTTEQIANADLVLYATPGSNSVLERIGGRLPIRLEGNAVVVGTQRHANREVGTRFIYPNPESAGRYVVVQGGVSTSAVERGHNLPDFLPDWIVYDARTTRTRERLITGRQGSVAMGYFDDRWQVPATPAASDATPSLDAQRRELLGVGPHYRFPPLVLAQTPPLTLPLTAPPPPPSEPTTYAVPETDPVGRIARRIGSMLPTFMNLRALVQGGAWRTTSSAPWQIRPQRECLEDLQEQGVRYSRVDDDLETLVATPVEVTAEPVEGVSFRMVRPTDRLIIGCELAARLTTVARVLRAHGVRVARVLSAYRNHPAQSLHTLGYALDLNAFELDNGETLRVAEDFVETPDALTCAAAPPEDRAARTLLAIACDLAATERFSTVITPNYNDGHRDHFHVDVRPYDPRLYVR